MINFTGSTNRRVVNLGERRRGRGGTFLQQTHLDHQQREEQRRKDRAAGVIHSYVKRYLELRAIADEIAIKWLRSPSDSVNWNRWCSEYTFIARYASRELLLPLFSCLNAGISSLCGRFTPWNVSTLVRGFKASLDRKIDAFQTLTCLSTLLDQYSLSREFPGASAGLSSRVAACINSENPNVLKMAFNLHLEEPVETFVPFLAQILPQYVYSDPTIQEITRLKLNEPKAFNCVSLLENEENLRLFANTVRILDSSFSLSDCHVLAIILSKMDFTILTMSEANEGNERENENTNELRVSGALASAILLLEHPAHLTKVIEQLRQWDIATEEIPLLPYLLKVLPDMRLKLSMMCTISPGILKAFYDQVANCEQFTTLKSYRYGFKGSNPIEIQDSVSKNRFSLLLYTYSQLLSYWLTVTNDQESFHESNFPIADACEFSQFLKNLTLMLVLKPSTFLWSPFTIVQQKNISVTLINQLYIKNLRVRFLAKDFWIEKSLLLNKTSMLTLLQAEQKRIEEEEDLSSDEEDTVKKPAEKFKRRKSTATKTLPMVEILKKMPFFVEFTERVEVFRGLVAQERERINLDPNTGIFMWDPHFNNLKADIRREHILEDAFESFHKTGDKFKHQLRVTFHNEYGEEAGIDGGGITKEFLTALVTDAFNPENSLHLFKETEDYNLYPNPDIYFKIINNLEKLEQAQKLAYMRFMGMVIGKCLFEGVLIDFKFAHFFLSKWRIAQSGTKSSIDDLAYLDKNLFRNLIKLMDMSDDQILELDLNFVVNESVDGQIYKFPLGAASESHQQVTAANRLRYIHQISNFKLNQCIQVQSSQFIKGLMDVIKPNWLNLFDPFELQMLISGTNDINLEDWKKHVNYGGYWETDSTIRYFWQVVEEMDAEDQQALVKFVTSVSRAPLLGFAALEPKFGISRVPDHTRLPTASTCANLLKLPQYKTKEELREKLLYSIHANSGFDLS